MATTEKAPPTWKFVLFGVIVGGGILFGFAFVIAKAVLEMSSGDARITTLCMSRLSKVAKAQLLYAADHDDTLPPAKVWIDATWPYGDEKGPKGQKIDPEEMNESIFKCPAITALRGGGYGYGFSSDLSQKKLSEEGKSGILIFDSRKTDRNVAGKPDHDQAAPGRHNAGMTNVFAKLDGSVETRPAQ